MYLQVEAQQQMLPPVRTGGVFMLHERELRKLWDLGVSVPFQLPPAGHHPGFMLAWELWQQHATQNWETRASTSPLWGSSCALCALPRTHNSPRAQI